MSSFLLEIDALGSFGGGNAPLMDVLIGGVVVSSSSVTSSASTYSFTLDYTGNFPSSLSFRFNTGSGDPGDSIVLSAVRINGQNVDTSNLSSLLLNQGNSSNVTNVDYLYGRTEPLSGDLGAPTINGTDGADNLNGDNEAIGDVIDAGSGDDRVRGLGSDDAIIGGAGADRIFGEGGNDIIIGEGGNDLIFGNDGNDLLHGGADNDRIIGGNGNDVLNGGSGNDGLIGNAGDDVFFGGDGNDFMIGDTGADIFYGDAGNDRIMGGDDTDIIHGGIGDDLIDAGAGDDIIFNEGGNDVISGGSGIDLFDATSTSSAVDIDLLNQVVNDDGEGGSDTIGFVENVDGSGFDDVVVGDDVDNVINGFNGTDTIEGSGGSDTINGGDGNDTLYAGTSGGSTQDQIDAILAANSGLVYSADTGNFYLLETTGANYATASANATANLINGVAGHIVTITSAAENTLIDSMIVASTWIAASDAGVEDQWEWIEGPENGVQFWQGIGSGSGGGAVGGAYSNWNGAGEPNDYGSGEDFAEIRTNGTWNDVTGTGSRDYVIEWEGTSLYTVATSDAGTTNTLDGGDGDDMLYGADGIDIILGGIGDDTATGGEGNDQINGNDGQDDLNGDAGDDTVYGDAGNDTVTGGVGDDVLYGGDGDDEINGDFAVGFVVTEPGWQYQYFDLASQPGSLATAGFTGGGPDNSNSATSTGFTQNLDPAVFDTGDDFALRFETTLTITTGGTYTFNTSSDDGSKLFLDGVEIVDNDGNHSTRTITSAGQVLTAGDYTLVATYYERGGGQVMGVNMSGPDTGGVLTDLGPYSGVTYQTVINANGDDTLYGGDGLDTLYGGDGADTFVFESTSAFNDTDVIDSFDTTQGDRIDLSDILSGLGVNAGNLLNFVDISFGSGVRVDVSGSGTFSAATQIASFSGTTTVTDEATLLTNSNLVI